MSTFWNVSIKVATYKLNDVISRLHGYDVSVLPADKAAFPSTIAKGEADAANRLAMAPKKPEPQWATAKKELPSQFLSGDGPLPDPAPEQAPRSSRPDYQRPPKKKRRATKKHKGLGWLIPPESQLQIKAQQALFSRGVQPFHISELIRDAEKIGSNKPAVYRAIWAAMADGNLVRLNLGRYQRTGQSFINSLGLAING
jgi:hypothetical protein